MSPTTRRALAVLVWLAILLLLAPLVLRMQADAGGFPDPCTQLWDPQRGVYNGCMVFLPAVVNCNECASAWPIMPDAEVSKP